MSNSNSTIKGAMWARRGVLAVAGTAMAFVSLVAAPSVASAAPPVKDTDTTVTVMVDAPREIGGKKIKETTEPVFSMLGGGWA